MYYRLTEKYEDIHDDFLMPKTEKFEEWLENTDNNVKLLSILACIINWEVAERFELADEFFTELEELYQYVGYTLTREEVTEAVRELFKQEYLEEV